MCGAPPFLREHENFPPDMFHIFQIVKNIGEKFPVEILPAYLDAATFLDVATGLNRFRVPIKHLLNLLCRQRDGESHHTFRRASNAMWSL